MSTGVRESLPQEKPGRLILKIRQKACWPSGQKEAQPAVVPSQTSLDKLKSAKETTSAKGTTLSAQRAESSNVSDFEEPAEQSNPQQLTMQSRRQGCGASRVNEDKKAQATPESHVLVPAISGVALLEASGTADQPVRQNSNFETECQPRHQSPRRAPIPQLAVRAPAVATAVKEQLQAKRAAPAPRIPAEAQTLQRKPAEKVPGRLKPGKKKDALKPVGLQKKGQIGKKGKLAKLRQIVSISAKLSSASHFTAGSSLRPASTTPSTRKLASKESGAAGVAAQRDQKAKGVSKSESCSEVSPEGQAVPGDSNQVANRQVGSVPPSTGGVAEQSHQAAQEEADALLNSSKPDQHAVSGHSQAKQSSCGLKPSQEGQPEASQRQQDRGGVREATDNVPSPSKTPCNLLQARSAVKLAKPSLKMAQRLEVLKTSKPIFKSRGLSMLQAVRVRGTLKQKQSNLSGHGVFFELTPRLSSDQPDPTSSAPPTMHPSMDEKASIPALSALVEDSSLSYKVIHENRQGLSVLYSLLCQIIHAKTQDPAGVQ